MPSSDTHHLPHLANISVFVRVRGKSALLPLEMLFYVISLLPSDLLLFILRWELWSSGPRCSYLLCVQSSAWAKSLLCAGFSFCAEPTAGVILLLNLSTSVTKHHTRWFCISAIKVYPRLKRAC